MSGEKISKVMKRDAVVALFEQVGAKVVKNTVYWGGKSASFPMDRRAAIKKTWILNMKKTLGLPSFVPYG
jgi:hypothetical protein